METFAQMLLTQCCASRLCKPWHQCLFLDYTGLAFVFLPLLYSHACCMVCRGRRQVQSEVTGCS